MQSSYNIEQMQKRCTRYGQVYALDNRHSLQADVLANSFLGTPYKMSSLNGQPPACAFPAGYLDGSNRRYNENVAIPPKSSSERNNAVDLGHSQNSQMDLGVQMSSTLQSHSFSTPIGRTPQNENNLNHRLDRMSKSANTQGFQMQPSSLNSPLFSNGTNNAVSADLQHGRLHMPAGPVLAQHVCFPPNPVSNIIQTEGQVPPISYPSLPKFSSGSSHLTNLQRQEIGQRLRQEYYAYMHFHYLGWIEQRAQALQIAGIKMPPQAIPANEIFQNPQSSHSVNEHSNEHLRSWSVEHRDSARNQQSRSREQIKERSTGPASVTPASLQDKQDGFIPVTRPTLLNIQVENEPYVPFLRQNTPRQKENENETRSQPGISSQLQNSRLQYRPSSDQDSNRKCLLVEKNQPRPNIQSLGPLQSNQGCRYEVGCEGLACVKDAQVDGQLNGQVAYNADLFGQAADIPAVIYQHVAQENLGVPQFSARSNVPTLQSVPHANQLCNQLINQNQLNKEGRNPSVNFLNLKVQELDSDDDEFSNEEILEESQREGLDFDMICWMEQAHAEMGEIDLVDCDEELESLCSVEYDFLRVPVDLDSDKKVMLREEMAPLLDMGSGKPGNCKVYEHRIEIDPPNHSPLKVRMRGLSERKQEVFDKTFFELLELKSPWSTPVFVRPEKDGTWRVIVDYRELNKITVPDKNPFPNIEDSLALLGGSKWFTVVDLAKSFYQIEMAQVHRVIDQHRSCMHLKPSGGVVRSSYEADGFIEDELDFNDSDSTETEMNYDLMEVERDIQTWSEPTITRTVTTKNEPPKLPASSKSIRKWKHKRARLGKALKAKRVYHLVTKVDFKKEDLLKYTHKFPKVKVLKKKKNETTEEK